MNILQKKRSKSLVKTPGKFSLIFVGFACLFLLGFLTTNADRQTNSSSLYEKLLKDLQSEIENFKQLNATKAFVPDLKKQFVQTRKAYKRLAVFSEYFNPYETKFLNGPALSRVEEDNPDVIIPPHGLQLIEEYLFKDWKQENYSLLQNELDFISGVIQKLQNEKDLALKFKDEAVIEALRSSVVRLMSLGISGFDSPIAKLSLQEAIETLSGIEEVLSLYKERLIEKNSILFTNIINTISGAKKYLTENHSFDSFDRLYFIKTFANPLYQLISQARNELSLQPLQGRRPLNTGVNSIFDANAFNVNFFSPDESYQVTPERIELGKKLFNDPILSQTKNRSCASCHKPELAFTDGLQVPISVDEKTLLSRNTPTLWNSVLQTRQFYDSRTDALENQLDEVVHNVDEMKGSLKQSVDELKKHSLYQQLFQKAYSKEKNTITAYTIANAISSYVRSLVSLNSKFDLYIRNQSNDFSNDEKKGFNLFMGKAKCGTCHFMPLFNGLVPPDFYETESEILGVPGLNKKELDGDLGKYNFTRSVIHKHSFKIPTLRNIELTAPYMHNGVFKTLEEVIDFYNKGGGTGLGYNVENQTLPTEKLKLSSKEKKQIIAFLKTLTDTSGRK